MKSDSDKILEFFDLMDKAKTNAIEFHYPKDSGKISVFDALETVAMPDDLLDNYDDYINILQELANKKDPRKIQNLISFLEPNDGKKLSFSEYDDKPKKFFALLRTARTNVQKFHFLPEDIGNHSVQPISLYDALDRISIFDDLDDLLENYDEYMRILQELADKKDPREIKNLEFLLKIPENRYLAFIS